MALRFPIAHTATIANAGTASNVVNLDGGTLVGLEIPAGMEGTTLTLKASSVSAAAVAAVADSDGNALTITITSAAAFIALNPVATHAFRWVQVIASAQTGPAAIGLVVRDMV